MNVLKKMEELIENYQCRKCEKCPCYYWDGYFAEGGCVIDEGRACKVLLKLFSRPSFILDNFSGCFIPLFIIKIVCKFEVWQHKRYTKKNNLGCKRK